MEIKLRQIRENRGISQEDMAKHLKISQPQYYRKEKGTSKILETEWEIISSILGVDQDQIRTSNFSPATFRENNNISCLHLLSASEELILELKEHIKTLKQKIFFIKDHYESRLKDKEEIITFMQENKKSK